MNDVYHNSTEFHKLINAITCNDNVFQILAMDQASIPRSRTLSPVSIRRQWRHQRPVILILFHQTCSSSSNKLPNRREKTSTHTVTHVNSKDNSILSEEERHVAGE